MKINKIIIEVTPKGWESTVTINGKEFKERHIATSTGAKSVEGDFENEDNIPDEVYDVLNTSFPFECMEALQKI
ncbi:hypothetical protein OCV73_00090 [Barnesiella propionica]|uniref:hypothetical protein n=1 Tax=Barnesiella propionica TaxID=2981781 RepID=UPI0021D27E64|nr:hypothetical protein [Barnesiella propionica]MCU6767361.1 hypothetical protein [Barnesiella propionica]